MAEDSHYILLDLYPLDPVGQEFRQDTERCISPFYDVGSLSWDDLKTGGDLVPREHWYHGKSSFVQLAAGSFAGLAGGHPVCDFSMESLHLGWLGFHITWMAVGLPEQVFQEITLEVQGVSVIWAQTSPRIICVLSVDAVIKVIQDSRGRDRRGWRDLPTQWEGSQSQFVRRA